MSCGQGHCAWKLAQRAVTLNSCNCCPDPATGREGCSALRQWGCPSMPFRVTDTGKMDSLAAGAPSPVVMLARQPCLSCPLVPHHGSEEGLRTEWRPGSWAVSAGAQSSIDVWILSSRLPWPPGLCWDQQRSCGRSKEVLWSSFASCVLLTSGYP